MIQWHEQRSWTPPNWDIVKINPKVDKFFTQLQIHDFYKFTELQDIVMLASIYIEVAWLIWEIIPIFVHFGMKKF